MESIIAVEKASESQINKVKAVLKEKYLRLNVSIDEISNLDKLTISNLISSMQLNMNHQLINQQSLVEQSAEFIAKYVKGKAKNKPTTYQSNVIKKYVEQGWLTPEAASHVTNAQNAYILIGKMFKFEETQARLNKIKMNGENTMQVVEKQIKSHEKFTEEQQKEILNMHIDQNMSAYSIEKKLNIPLGKVTHWLKKNGLFKKVEKSKTETLEKAREVAAEMRKNGTMTYRPKSIMSKIAKRQMKMENKISLNIDGRMYKGTAMEIALYSQALSALSNK